jgi:hypothetical protein
LASPFLCDEFCGYPEIGGVLVFRPLPMVSVLKQELCGEYAHTTTKLSRRGYECNFTPPIYAACPVLVPAGFRKRNSTYLPSAISISDFAYSKLPA